MRRITDDRWRVLAGTYSAAWIEHYRTRLSNHGAFFEVGPAEQDARDLLDALAAGGYLEKMARQICPACRVTVDDETQEQKRCSCGFSFEHEEPGNAVVYSRPGLRTRDPRWLVTVHGMNTHGQWQEEFAWRLTQIYGYAIPVAIYKYGRILVSPFLLTSQERYARRFLARLQTLRLEMDAEGYGDRPDVIAHSFGTWLLARALDLDPNLRLGRVVLTGSIIPPDYPWHDLLRGHEPRVEAVLCHHAGRDMVVPLAQFFVPRSGPSGCRGFNAQPIAQAPVCHVFESTFDHSSYFADANLKRVMTVTWGPFLTQPDSALPGWGDASGVRASRQWRRSRLAAFTHAFKYGVLALAALLVAAAVTSFLLGVPHLLRLLR